MIYFIPTPIWNLKDITLRALDFFKELDIFLCEDTRTLKQLLNKYNIDYSNKKFYSLTSYTNKNKIKFYTDLIKENDVWVVSEAWTPWLSDPWKEIIKLAWEQDLKFEVLTWANALSPALVSCFCDTSKILFLWFLPIKKWRQTLIKKALAQDFPVFIYESVYRIEKTVNQFQEFGFEGNIFLIREISKMYEQKFFWKADTLIEKIHNWEIKLKWEFVLWFIKTF